MNSSQRRKARRELPHIVPLIPKPEERYFTHDNRVEKARSWCKKQCKGEWRSNEQWDHALFKFATERDATFFALKWT